MQLNRYTQSGALFAESMSSITDMTDRGATVSTLNGGPVVIGSPYGYAVRFSRSYFDTISWALGDAKTLLCRVQVRSGETGAGIWSATEKLAVVNGVLTATSFTDETLYVDGVAGSSLSVGGGVNAWHTVAVTSTTSFSLSSSKIGDIDFSGGVAIRDFIAFDRVLSAAEIMSIHNGTMFQYDMNLVSRWDMSTINPPDLGWRMLGNDGVGTGLVASTDIVDSHNGMGKAIEFNGSGEFITIANSASIQIASGGLTYSGWVKTASLSGYLIAKRSPTEGAISLFLSAGRMIAIIGTSVQTGSNTDLRGSSWHHTVMTYDGSKISYFLDGEPDGTDTSLTGSVDETTDLYLACRGGPASYLNGSIDDVRIYDSALTELQVRDVYEQSR